MKQTLHSLMEESGVRFGTSGVRGLAERMTDRLCYAYTRGFLGYLRETGQLPGTTPVLACGGDLRPSTGRILAAVVRAVIDGGGRPVHCGRLPSPALAWYSFGRRIPSAMVTGSHIPADRNGIKFNRPDGEILKGDEAGIARQVVELPAGLFDNQGALRAPRSLPIPDPCAVEAYAARYVEGFGAGCLAGLRVAVYQHSAVGRDVLVEVLERLGARVTGMARTDRFVPVDTEAIRVEDVTLAQTWCRDGAFDAVVSTDGDSDRPLLGDERGHWFRGDEAAVLCARFLGAEVVCTPVNSNTAVERCGWFRDVRRTRIGSPYVIEAMIEAVNQGHRAVVGYEANGGFLTATPLETGRGTLGPLPTRDALILLLSVLVAARQRGASLSALRDSLPRRFTASDRLTDFPPDRARAVIERLNSGDFDRDRQALEAFFGADLGRVKSVDCTDGLRVTLANDEVLHLRPSGNAPEFRCYAEAAAPERASALVHWALKRIEARA